MSQLFAPGPASLKSSSAWLSRCSIKTHVHDFDHCSYEFSRRSSLCSQGADKAIMYNSWKKTLALRV